MALSNVFREPRREITETLVGLAGTAGVLGADFLASNWTLRLLGGPPDKLGDRIFFTFLAMIAIPLGVAALIRLLAIVHALGDEICNALEDRGVHLRPRHRR